MKHIGITPEPSAGDTPIKAIAAAVETPKEPNYPILRLDRKQAALLGIDNGETVGDTITLKVKCKVTSVGSGYGGTPKDGEAPEITLDITHGEISTDSDPDQDGDNDENDDTNPDKDEDTEDGDEQELKNTRPKPRVLSPTESGFGDLND